MALYVKYVLSPISNATLRPCEQVSQTKTRAGRLDWVRRTHYLPPHRRYLPSTGICYRSPDLTLGAAAFAALYHLRFSSISYFLHHKHSIPSVDLINHRPFHFVSPHFPTSGLFLNCALISCVRTTNCIGHFQLCALQFWFLHRHFFLPFLLQSGRDPFRNWCIVFDRHNSLSSWNFLDAFFSLFGNFRNVWFHIFKRLTWINSINHFSTVFLD